MNVELDTGDMILNLGPQHPATHGTLRLVVRLDGERVVAADPVIGYMHRGYEKLTEFRTYPQITTLINRIDWLSSFANEVPFIHARRAAHGHRGAAARAVHPHRSSPSCRASRRSCCSSARWACRSARSRRAFYGFRDREHVLNLIEAATGGRFHPNFNRIGGLKDDLPWGWITECRDAMMKVVFDVVRHVRGPRRRQRDLRGAHPLDRHHPGRARRRRTACRARTCARRASTGTCAATASRTSSYPELDFKVWTHPDGDSFARYWVRLQETRESARMVLQMLDRLPAGPIMAKVPRIIKVPEGEVWVETENPLGQMGYYVVSKGATGPFRVKIRSASFSNVSILPWLLRGVYVPDVITILASLYFILGDIDR